MSKTNVQLCSKTAQTAYFINSIKADVAKRAPDLMSQKLGGTGGKYPPEM